MGTSNLRILIRTTFVTYVLTAVFLLILAFSLYQFHLSEGQVHLGVNAIYIASCFIGGILAGKAARVRRFVWGLITGSVYFLVLFAASWLIHKGIGSSVQELALIYAMCAGSGTVGGMVS